MDHAILLVFIFGTIAVAHHTASHRLATASVPWLALVSHPAILDTTRDILIHTLVYSGLSPLHFM